MWSRTRVVPLVAGGGLALLLGLLVAPRTPQLVLDGATGDQDLARAVLALVGEAPHGGLAVAVVEGDAQVRTAGLGTADGQRPVTADTPFEAGSVTKAMVGMVLQDLSEAGVVAADARVGEVLPDVAGAPVGEVTLEALAQHRGGLPPMAPGGPGGFLRLLGSTWFGADPYGRVSDEALVASAADSALTAAPDTYSNFGFGLLGSALASATGTELEALLEERLWSPLGMTATGYAQSSGPLPDGHARPHRGSTTPVSAWSGQGYLGAGAGIWSTADDLAAFAHATRTGRAPGASAAQPRHAQSDRHRIGLGWIVSDVDGHEVTWHNGGTGGMRSFVGFDAGRSVVVLARGDRSVDHVGLGLLGAPADPPPAVPGPLLPMLLVTIGLPVSAAASLLLTVTRGTGAARPLDRLRLAARMLNGTLLLLVTWRAGLWGVVPPALWTASLTLFGAGVGLAWHVWSASPVVASGRPVLRWADVTLTGLVFVVAAGFVLGSLGS